MTNYKQRLAGRPKVRRLAERVALDHGITLDELFGRSQKGRITVARVKFWRGLQEMGWSLPDIGEMSGRHHTTVLSGLRTEQRRSA